jgi:hypothetical protein
VTRAGRTPAHRAASQHVKAMNHSQCRTGLIGRDGRAVARAIGPREWASAEARALIESLLMEPAGWR